MSQSIKTNEGCLLATLILLMYLCQAHLVQSSFTPTWLALYCIIIFTKLAYTDKYSVFNNKLITLQWVSTQKCMLRVKQGPKMTLQWTYDISQTEPTQFLAESSLCSTWTAITSVCVFIALPNTSHDIRHFSAWSCDTPTNPPGPSFLQLLLPMWKPWQRPVGTSLWHIAFILCEVWGRVQVLLWEKMEPRPQEPQTFQNGGRLPTTTQQLPVWLLSDHLLEQS